jgi:NhaP-type Na+/H+ and K+/H+ antiporter
VNVHCSPGSEALAVLRQHGLPGAPVTRHSVAMDVAVGKDSPLAGRAVRDGGLPPGSVIVAVRRDGQNIPVSGGTLLEEGDVLSIFASPDRLSAARPGPCAPAGHTPGSRSTG